MTAIRKEFKEKAAFFRQLYDRYGSKMYVKALECGSPPEYGWDMVQESLNRLIMHYDLLSQLPPPAQSAYIFTTVRSVVVNRWEKFDPGEPEDPAELEEGEPLFVDLSGGSSPEERMLAREREQKAFEALNKLPDKERLLLEERYFLELSMEEMAGSRGITEGNLRVQLYRARKKLKKIMEAMDYEF